ncbi:MAG: PQQ-like beta-propeller repeat protein [Candidatus Kuenenia sp.]|nr:PQQ-like beta-propeller repeat protein [Candidatus Kuenenia hertensis]
MLNNHLFIFFLKLKIHLPKRVFFFVFNIVSFLALIVFSHPTASICSELADTPWPMFRHDLQHTGQSPFKSIQHPHIKWAFQTEGAVTSSPCIGNDGTIYFGSQDTKFYAVSREGKLKWNFQTQGEV